MNASVTPFNEQLIYFHGHALIGLYETQTQTVYVPIATLVWLLGYPDADTLMGDDRLLDLITRYQQQTGRPALQKAEAASQQGIVSLLAIPFLDQPDVRALLPAPFNQPMPVVATDGATASFASGTQVWSEAEFCQRLASVFIDYGTAHQRTASIEELMVLAFDERSPEASASRLRQDVICLIGLGSTEIHLSDMTRMEQLRLYSDTFQASDQDGPQS